MEIGRIVGALADLAPGPTGPVLDVAKGSQPFVWVDAGLTDGKAQSVGSGRDVTKLAAIDALHRDERLLRLGAYFVWGTGTFGDSTANRSVRLPLVTLPVRLTGGEFRGFRLVPAGDLEISPVVAPGEFETRLELVGGADPGWLREAAAAAGFQLADVLPRRPNRFPDQLFGVTAAALFVSRNLYAPDLRGTLRSWASRAGLDQTALAAVYGLDSDLEAPAAENTTEALRSPLPLNAAQREVVRRSRTERIVVVSGPPGNGKSHAVVAAAIDAVDRGLSVLVAAQSTHAVDALGELLRRYPGPVPVLFGDAEKRDVISTELTAGLGQGHGGGAVATGEAAAAAAVARVERLEEALTAALDYEQRAERAGRWGPLLPALESDAPAIAAPDLDLAGIEALLDRAQEPADGWWRGWRRGRAERALRRLLRARAGTSLDRLRTVLEAAGDVRAAAELASRGGTELGPVWDELDAADAALAEALGQAVNLRARSGRRWNGDGRRAVSALAAALRSSRSQRRQALTALDGPALVRALPLWVGTVADVEDLLPPTPGLFDLVIVDEASHVDQVRAAPVLARAKRALVIGDPKQLRFVSFIADVDVAATLDRHDLGTLADRLDVRRSSLFDVAAGSTAVTWLDEHYRSVPHLIEFSARRFYGGRISLATRHPRNEETDAIDVIRIGTAAGSFEAADDSAGAVEVAAVAEQIRKLAAAGVTGIGVVTPFRSQADALEAMLVSDFPLAEIDRLGLRVGTVHAFQGSEADHVIVSLGLTDADSTGRRRFASDPNLFNVMTTRARRRLLVVTELTGANGLVGEYLAYSESPPAAPFSGNPADGWVGALATELVRAGLSTRARYPVGKWRVDLCVGDGADAMALICGPHPDGAGRPCRAPPHAAPSGLADCRGIPQPVGRGGHPGRGGAGGQPVTGGPSEGRPRARPAGACGRTRSGYRGGSSIRTRRPSPWPGSACSGSRRSGGSWSAGRARLRSR